MPDLQIGFIPLVDCALLAIAKEQGFFEAHGIAVELHKAQSWSAIRENLGSGQLDAAHLLLTIPIQSVLEKDPNYPALCHAFTLSRNGNGIILSNALWNQGIRTAEHLAHWLSADFKRTLCLGVVFPRGTQEYFLRFWLAMGGLSIGPRISLKIIPPQEMVGRLRKNEIDGFCVGDPWSRRAMASKLGRLAADSREFFPGLGEKVLAVRAGWHGAHQQEHAMVIQSLSMAGDWLADPDNIETAADIVASKRYVNTPKSVVEASLRSRLDKIPETMQGRKFDQDGAHFPSRSHVHWYIEQMQRHGHAESLACTRLNVESICLEKFHYDSVSATRGSPVRHFQTGKSEHIVPTVSLLSKSG